MKARVRRQTGISAAMLLLAASAVADWWELRSAGDDAPGSAEIEAGRVDEAIRLLVGHLESATGPARLAVLQNLCVAHAMQQEYNKATKYCDRAVARKDADAAAFNNRGVVRAITGDYRGAIQDFQRAERLASCGADCDDGLLDVVRKNLERVRERSAERKL